MMLRWTLPAIALLLLAASPAPAQQQATAKPECARAKSKVEKAVCGNAEASAADSAMASAYSALKAALPADQQAGLLANQRDWITNREAACGEKAGDDLNACVKRESEARRAFLAGDGPNGAGDLHLRPAFYKETRKGKYDIDILYPRLAAERNPGEMAFDKAARDFAIQEKALKEFRETDPSTLGGSTNFLSVSYDVPYLGPRLAVIGYAFSEFTGGAHPNSGRSTLIFDLGKGRAATLQDVFANPDQAIAALAPICLDRLKKDAASDGGELFDDANPVDTMKEIKSWAPTRSGVTVQFDPYAVAAYAYGPRDCTFTYAELAPWLKKDGPLPPQ